MKTDQPSDFMQEYVIWYKSLQNKDAALSRITPICDFISKFAINFLTPEKIIYQPGLQIRRSNSDNLGIIFNISPLKHIL